MPGKLAIGSEALNGSKQFRVNAARIRGKKPYLIRGGLQRFFLQKSAAAIVVDGVTSIQGGIVKAIHRAKGQTVRNLSRKKRGHEGSRHPEEGLAVKGRLKAER